MASKYGTGTPTQFTDGTARQVLELGNLIHMFNRSETPLLAMFAKSNTVTTPVPVFDWQEDEYMIKRSVVCSGKLRHVFNATTGNNDAGVIIDLDRSAYLELFEKGAVYTVTAENAVIKGGTKGVMCIAIGEEVALDSGAKASTMVQFVQFDEVNGDSFTYNKLPTTVALFTGDPNGTFTFTYVGNAGAGSLSGVVGASANQTNLTDNDVFLVLGLTGHAEGAGVHKASRKKVRRLKNCTQIFRESYDITGTADAAKQYGPKELVRLQTRKLKKIKVDLEYSLLINGAPDFDETAENPKRNFRGFGVGKPSGEGFVKSFNGNDNADMQISFSLGVMDDFDAIESKIFEDVLEGGLQKDVYCSSKWLRFMKKIVRESEGTSLNAEMGKEIRAGLRVTSYQGAIGEMNFIRHPMLTGALENYAVAVDFNNFDVRPLRTRNLQLRKDIVKDGTDGRTDEWLVESGPEIRNEQTHAIIKLT